MVIYPPTRKRIRHEEKAFIKEVVGQWLILQNRDARHLAFPARSKAICVERDAESAAYLYENAVVEQFKLLQPLF